MNRWLIAVALVVCLLAGAALFWLSGGSGTARPPQAEPARRPAAVGTGSGRFGQNTKEPAESTALDNKAAASRMEEALQILDPRARRMALAKLGGSLGASDPQKGWSLLATVTGLQDRQEFAGALVEAWAGHSTPEALAACAQLPPGELQAVCTSKAIGIWAETNPKNAIEWAAANLGGSIRQSAITEAAAKWASQNPEAAAGWAAGLAGTSSGGTAVAEVMGYWAETDPQAAAGWAAKLPEGSFKQTALASLALNWADQFPEEAAGWAAKQSNARELLEIVGGSWAKSDPLAASTWASALQDESSRKEILSLTLASWAAASPQSALEWVGRAAPAEAGELQDRVLGGWAAEDPASALAWAREHNVPEANQTALFKQWAAASPETLETWIDAQPPQSIPDAALGSAALRAGEQRPAAALDRALAIRDSSQRFKTVRKILSSWQDSDPAAAQVWAAKHPITK